MQDLADNGLIVPKIPVTEDDEKLDRLCKDYRDWINIHQGSNADVLKVRPGEIPFFDDFSTFQIRDRIRKKTSPKPIEKPDPLFNARLFLQLTQEFDAQNS